MMQTPTAPTPIPASGQQQAPTPAAPVLNQISITQHQPKNQVDSLLQQQQQPTPGNGQLSNQSRIGTAPIQQLVSSTLGTATNSIAVPTPASNVDQIFGIASTTMTNVPQQRGTAIEMFAAGPNTVEDNPQSSLDLDELFRDCYFGDFPVPNYAQPEPVLSSSEPTTSTQVPLAPPSVANPITGMKRKAEIQHPQVNTSAQAPATIMYQSMPAPVAGRTISSTIVPAALSSTATISGPPPFTINHQNTGYGPLKSNMTGGVVAPKALTESQKVERRERNREHAKRSRLRKKFLLESLQDQIHGLQSEIESLRSIIKTELPQKADSLLSKVVSGGGCGQKTIVNGREYTPLPMPSGFGPVKTLMEPDYRLMSALSSSQQNFAISDPSLPDNPIVYVSQGFLDLTGYTLDQVLGRNCRFLQGPGTDQNAVDVIRKGVRDGVDTSVCLLNYKADGTPFWNQFFVAALRDAENNVVNFVGVQCEVSKATVEREQEQSGGVAQTL